MTDAWRKFVQQLDEQDELWLFSSPDDSFGKGSVVKVTLLFAMVLFVTR